VTSSPSRRVFAVQNSLRHPPTSPGETMPGERDAVNQSPQARASDQVLHPSPEQPRRALTVSESNPLAHTSSGCGQICPMLTTQLLVTAAALLATINLFTVLVVARAHQK
jgi:hypothetical protein